MKTAVAYEPAEILVEKGTEHFTMTRRILEEYAAVLVRTIADCDEARLQVEAQKNPKTLGKQILALVRHKGKFLKPRAYVPHYLCYNYHYLYWGTNCHLECTYCILQAFLNNPLITVFVNTNDMLRELEEDFSQPDTFWRVSAGEVADSLALEPATGLMQELIPFFARQNRASLELKTKTSLVDRLLQLEHRGRTILSWSLNTPRVISEEELKTSDLDDRLAAAKRAQEAGYPVGFHFDPMVHYEEWEKDYRGLIQKVFSQIDPRHVAWVSLGGLRFLPDMKKIIEERFPKSRLIYGEQIRGTDGKSRYFRPLRSEMFRKMAGWLREISPDFFIYLCMETSEVWQESLGWVPESDAHLSSLMDARARRTWS